MMAGKSGHVGTVKALIGLGAKLGVLGKVSGQEDVADLIVYLPINIYIEGFEYDAVIDLQSGAHRGCESPPCCWCIC